MHRTFTKCIGFKLGVYFQIDRKTDPIHQDDVIKWKHFPRNWPFAQGIHQSPVNSPHKGQWCGALMFSFICLWINDWVNNREAGDLRCYHAHYDVIVMPWNNGTNSGVIPSIFVNYSYLICQTYQFTKQQTKSSNMCRHFKGVTAWYAEYLVFSHRLHEIWFGQRKLTLFSWFVWLEFSLLQLTSVET